MIYCPRPLAITGECSGECNECRRVARLMASVTENIRVENENGDAYRFEVKREGDKATVRIWTEQIGLKPPEVSMDELIAGMRLVEGVEFP